MEGTSTKGQMMPIPTKNAPDWIDVENMCAALAEEFGCIVTFTTRLRGGKVEVIGKSTTGSFSGTQEVLHVALVTWPVQLNKDMAQACYTLAFDLWCQHDGGGATAADRGPPYDWRGRVETPRRRRAQ